MFKFAGYDDCYIRTEGNDFRRRYFIESKTNGTLCNMNLGGGYMEMLPSDYHRDDVMIVKDMESLSLLKDNGLVIQELGSIRPGYVAYPVIQFSHKRFMKFGMKPVADIKMDFKQSNGQEKKR